MTKVLAVGGARLAWRAADKTVHWIGVLEEGAGMVGLVAIAVLVNLQFIDRFSSNPYIWTEEVSRICMIWVAYLGCAAVTRRGLHIGVDVVTQRLPVAARKAWTRFLNLLTAAIFGFVSWQGWLLIGSSRGVELVASEWPIVVIVWPLVIGCGLGCLHALYRCIREPIGSAADATLIQDI